MNYFVIEHEYNKHAFKLLDIVKECNVPIEGNVFSCHQSYEVFLPARNKRINLFNLSKDQKTILEIGFNAGHSCLIYLLSNPNSVIYAFDICIHPYVLPCLEYLQKTFGKERIIFTPGNSVETLRDFKGDIDMFHIDGGHIFEVVKSDLENCYRISRLNSIIVIDDTNIPHILDLWKKYIEEEKIRPCYIYPLLETDIWTHEVGIVNKFNLYT